MGCTSCSSLLYHPSHSLHFPPEEQDLHPQELWIPLESESPGIFAWYLSSNIPKHSKALILFFHGNGENLSSHYLSFSWLLKHGYDLLAFDYRGYGRSPGRPSPRKTVEDGKAVVRWAAQHHPQLPRVLLGQSLGAAVALRTAIEIKSEIPIHLIIADSGFLSYQKVARQTLASFWLTWIFQPLAWIALSDADAPGKRISELAPIPLVVIHGDQDTTVHFDLGQEIYDQAQEPKELWVIPQGKHTDSMWRSDINMRGKLLHKLDSLFKSVTIM